MQCSSWCGCRCRDDVGRGRVRPYRPWARRDGYRERGRRLCSQVGRGTSTALRRLAAVPQRRRARQLVQVRVRIRLCGRPVRALRAPMRRGIILTGHSELQVQVWRGVLRQGVRQLRAWILVPHSAHLTPARLRSALRGGWDRRSDARLGLACGCRQAVGAWPKASLNVSIHVGSELWHGEAELAQYAGFPPETRASGSSYRFTSADASIVRPLDLQDERGPASTESKSYANTMCTHARSEVPS